MTLAAERQQADAELGQILALTGPFAWTDSGTATGWFGQYEFDGIIKLPDVFTAVTASAYRIELAAQFERMLDSLERAGWQPVDGFEVTFTTGVRNFTQTLAGEMTEPSRQGGIKAAFRLRLGRAR